MKRNSKVILIIGGRGTGKTTYLEKLVENKDNAVIFQLMLDNRYKGKTKLLYQDFTICRGLCNKTIVIEDATQLIGSNPKNDIRKIVVSSKQMGSDVIFVFHSFNVVPPYLWQLFDFCVIFPCAEVKKTAGLTEYYDEICKIQRKKPVKYRPLYVLQAH